CRALIELARARHPRGEPCLPAARHDANGCFAVVAKAHAVVHGDRVDVAAQDVKKRRLATLHFAADQRLDQPSRETPALVGGVRANAADLSEGAGAHALAGHGHQAIAFKATHVLAQFDRPRAEWARTGEPYQSKHL